MSRKQRLISTDMESVDRNIFLRYLKINYKKGTLMGFIRTYRKKDGTESDRVEIRLKGFVVRKTYRTKSLAKREMQKIEAAIQGGRYKNLSAVRVLIRRVQSRSEKPSIMH